LFEKSRILAESFSTGRGDIKPLEGVRQEIEERSSATMRTMLGGASGGNQEPAARAASAKPRPVQARIVTGLRHPGGV
jgi:hypothetical protein